MSEVVRWQRRGNHRANGAVPGGVVEDDVPALVERSPAALVRIAAPEDLTRAGRHTEPEWHRTLHDPRRDEIDALGWLGFGLE